MATVEVNGRAVAARDGETLLELLARTGIAVPTLCHIAGLEPSGSCRLCVVESSDTGKLITACTTPAAGGMRILTHSPRVLDARRTNLELLLSHHADDCLYCARSADCRVRALAAELGLAERRFGTVRREARIDKTAPGLLRDPAKCVLCGRCVRICEEIQSVAAIDLIRRGCRLAVGTPFDVRLAETGCVRCGQCLVACPTGAIADNFDPEPLMAALADPERIVTVSVEPGVIPALEARYQLGGDAALRIVSALRIIGFDRVFDTAIPWQQAAEAAARELRGRTAPGPLILPFCPAAGRFIREHLPAYTALLSTGPAPRTLHGAQIKSGYAKRVGFTPETLFTVAVSPCLAARDEAVEAAPGPHGRDLDAALTLRDLVHLFDLFHIDLTALPPAPFDRDFGPGDPEASSGGNPGEFAAAVARLIATGPATLATERPFPGCTLFPIGLETPAYYAVVAGLANARRFFTDILPGRGDIRFVEIDACPEGCLHGGGQLETGRP